jgi:hypothetical protein
MSKMPLPSLEALLGKDTSKHEPAVPALLKNSEFFPKSLGMRQVPELLIIELFREVCFHPHRPSHDNKARELAPSADSSKEEVALLFIARGRNKRTKNIQKPKTYFGPLFPGLARNAWARKEAERVIASQFLERPLAQYVIDNNIDVHEFASDIVSALYGKTRSENGNCDIFTETLDKIDIDKTTVGLSDPEDATGRLKARLEGAREDILGGDSSDVLARSIGSDFHNLCKLAENMPRIMWMELLKSFLRLALPSWLLAHMRLTVLLRDWTLSAFGGTVVDDAMIEAGITSRGQGLFHPTQTGSNEVTLHIQNYVKARVELSLLTYLVRHALGEKSIEGTLTSTKNGKGRIPVSEWLVRCRNAGEFLGLNGTPTEIRLLIIPFAQQWGAWLDPQENGQGKNIEEFLRILLRLSKADDDDGYILTSTAKGGFEKAVLFPGPAMLRAALVLASARKRGSLTKTQGKLVLSDLEGFFADYGVDFAASAGARPQLISELSRLGFLKGSPDAGDSAELVAPNFGE